MGGSARSELQELDRLRVGNGPSQSLGSVKAYIRLVTKWVTYHSRADTIDDQVSALEVAEGYCQRVRGRVVRHVFGLGHRIAQDRVINARRAGRIEDVPADGILHRHDCEQRVLVHHP